MKKAILLMLFCFSMTILSAQETRTFDTKNSEQGKAIGGRLVKNEIITGYYSTSGDYLVDAGSLQLFGAGLIVGGAALVLIDRKFKESNETLVGVGIISVVSGFVCSIYAPIMIIKAGKALNEEREISLHPSSEGIGLALKF